MNILINDNKRVPITYYNINQIVSFLLYSQIFHTTCTYYTYYIGNQSDFLNNCEFFVYMFNYLLDLKMMDGFGGMYNGSTICYLKI